MAFGSFALGCWCPQSSSPHHIFLIKHYHGRPIHGHHSLYPLPCFLSWKEDWCEILREHAIPNEANEASLQMLHGLIKCHELYW
jgi:hypothetical protein